jgi:beta-galactosidase
MTINYQFGVDYYPEHWPEERWETDARLMNTAGLKIVRLAEFAWQKMEPEAGRYDFAWLDRALAVFAKHGIQAVLGTPSAAPPAWLVTAHPDILPVDSQGIRRGFGGRHHDCQSNPTYRTFVADIVTAMARQFGADPRVVGWQTDNELGNSHEDFCHCDSCRDAFHLWLQDRYTSIDALNRAWGTVFWSQTYDAFEQIPTPRVTPNAHNPSLLLDWKRFRSDLIVDFQQKQIDILRQQTNNQFITHNFMGLFDLVDYFGLAGPLDFASHDQYPTGYWDPPQGKEPASLAAALDLIAGLKAKSFWVMEQQAGPTGWQTLARTPRPGQLALWAAQSVARGADTVVFFRWRACVWGTEQFWHGILPHNGVPGRRYDEIRQLISRLAPVMPRFEGALAGAEAAILYSYEQNWAMEIQPHHPDLNYVNIAEDFYRAFFERNVPVTFVRPEADLSGYKLVVAPLLYLELPGVFDRITRFVENGGTVVFTPRTGVKTHSNVVQTDHPLPGRYLDMLGLEVLDYDCLRGAEVEVPFDGGSGRGRFWWDVVTAKGAQTHLYASDHIHDREPALTSHRYGQGTAWYVATFPDETLMRAMVALWIDASGVTSLGASPPGVELALRRTSSTDYLFAMNHGDQPRVFAPDSGWRPVIGGTELGPFGFSLFERPRTPV